MKVAGNAVKHFMKDLNKSHVLEESQVRSIIMSHLRPIGLEMDSIEHTFPSFSIQFDNKYYPKSLGDQRLTNTRNVIIEILIKAEKNQFKKNMLVKEV